jgi:hypothetical protein
MHALGTAVKTFGGAAAKASLIRAVTIQTRDYGVCYLID